MSTCVIWCSAHVINSTLNGCGFLGFVQWFCCVLVVGFEVGGEGMLCVEGWFVCFGHPILSKWVWWDDRATSLLPTLVTLVSVWQGCDLPGSFHLGGVGFVSWCCVL